MRKNRMELAQTQIGDIIYNVDWNNISLPDTMDVENIKSAFDCYNLRYLIHAKNDYPALALNLKLKTYSVIVYENFVKMCAAYDVKYNPVENYDRTELTQNISDGNDTFKTSGSDITSDGGVDVFKKSGTEKTEKRGGDENKTEYGSVDSIIKDIAVKTDHTGFDTRTDDITTENRKEGQDEHITDGSVITQTDGLSDITTNSSGTDHDSISGQDIEYKGTASTDSVTGDNATSWYDSKKIANSGQDRTEYGKKTDRTKSDTGSSVTKTDDVVNQTNDTTLTDKYGSTDNEHVDGTVTTSYNSGEVQKTTGTDNLNKSGQDVLTTTFNNDSTIINDLQNRAEYGKTETTEYGKSEVTEYGKKEYVESRIHGNIGVTTNQQMISAEIDLRSKYLADLWVIGFISRHTVV